MSLTVYSVARAQQLRYLLWAAVVIGALMLGLATFVVVLGGSGRYAAFVTVPALLVLASAVTALRRLEERGVAARWWSVGTGLLLLVLGLLLAAATVGILPSIVGILLILMALLPGTGDH